MQPGNFHIAVLGAGFGGLTFCQSFRHPRARITLVDRQNHHLFQPLLYQVATAGLSGADIAEPVRSMLRARPDITVLMDEVTEVQPSTRTVTLRRHRLSYDALVVAMGGITSYFGHPEWEAVAPGLKSLGDALRIRNEVLLAFERAESEDDPAVWDPLLRVVVVGGGPTGVELAGAFAELARHVLRRDFRRIDPTRAQILLLEAGPRLLGHLSEHLSARARAQLERLGVVVRTNVRVEAMAPGRITLHTGEVIEAANIIWAAGVRAHPMAARLGAPLDAAGRVCVLPDLSLPGHPEVFVIGDMARVNDAQGRPVPGVSPAAMQMARFVARRLRNQLGNSASRPAAPAAFRYRDKGVMATVGRSRAVARVGRLELSGHLAWWAWLLVHLYFLIGFENKLVVLWQWAYSYFTYKRGARIIISNGRKLAAGPATTISAGL